MIELKKLKPFILIILYTTFLYEIIIKYYAVNFYNYVRYVAEY